EVLPYRVVRPPLLVAGALHASIAQPEPSGERWDRFLAREVGGSRAAVARAAASGALRLLGASSPARPVRDGQGFSLDGAAALHAQALDEPPQPCAVTQT